MSLLEKKILKPCGTPCMWEPCLHSVAWRDVSFSNAIRNKYWWPEKKNAINSWPVNCFEFQACSMARKWVITYECREHVTETSPILGLWPTCLMPALVRLITGDLIMSQEYDELNTCAVDQSPNPWSWILADAYLESHTSRVQSRPVHTTLALLAARTIATNAAPSTNPFTCGTATPRTPVRAQHSDGQNVTAHKIAHLATTPSFGFHDRTRSPRFSIHRPPKCPPLPQAWFRCGSAKLAAESQDLPLLALVRVRFRNQYSSLSLLLNHWSAGPFSGRSTRPFAQIRLGSLKSSPCHWRHHLRLTKRAPFPFS